MARYIQSPQAAADIYEIAEYIAKESPKAAERWVDEVTQLFQLLASQPAAW
jgi:plasmid stabilization system protein ParE